MPSSYSPLLRLELIGAGEQSGLWGDTTNKNLGQLLEQAIAGVTTVALSGGAGDYTLTALDGTFDEARSAVLKFAGNPSGAKNIIIPTETKLYVVRNDCGQSIFIKTSAQVTGVRLLDGEASLVFCDGANALAGIATEDVGTLTVSGGGTGVTSFSGGFVKSPGGTGGLTSALAVNLTSEVSDTLPVGNGGTGASSFSVGVLKSSGGGSAITSSAVALGSEVSGTLPVGNGGTGITNFLSGRLLIGNGTGPVASLAGSVIGQLATWDGTQWVASTPPAAGGVTSFAGRTGAVSPISGDYSAFYTLLNGSNATGSWPINAATTTNGVVTTGSYSDPSWITSLAGAKISGTVGNSGALGGVPASLFARRDASNAFTSANTFVNGGITSPAYNFTSTSSIYFNGQMEFAINTNPRMTLTSAGNLIITGTLTQGSDKRLKDNIQDYTKGLDVLSNIKVRSWEYNGKGNIQAGRKGVGVVADEIASIMPEMVIETEGKLNPEDTETTSIKMVDALQMTWLLVKSVQELKAEVDELRAQLQAKT